MHRYGVSNEDFGRYSVVARKHAATNPNAWYYGRPITLEDHQSSRWIVEPILRLLDCCQESDGGVALVVTRADRAKDLRQPVVRIEAATQGNLLDGDVMFNYYGADTARFAEAEYTARQLWETTGLRPDDIDVAMIYENFSPVVFYQLEAYGFCGPGEAKDFIADGNIELGGKVPVNTNGGLLGRGIHPRREQHPRRSPPTPRHRGQSGGRRTPCPVQRRPQRRRPRRGPVSVSAGGERDRRVGTASLRYALGTEDSSPVGPAVPR